VLDLATRLRNSGVDAIIDRWELRSVDDLPHFMETHLTSSDYVVMVCTDNYVAKTNSGSGGVGYEKMIVTAELLSSVDSNKIVPIIRQFGTHNVPTFLKTKLFVNFSNEDEYEFSFDELVRTFHGSPIFKKPEIGNNPFTPIADTPQEKSGDAIREIMKIVLHDFESGENWTVFKNLVQRIAILKVMLDMLLADAASQGLIRLDSDGDVRLENKGKQYAIQHKLVRA
jgi:hypothetical protein